MSAIVEIEKLGKQYGERWALRDVDLSIGEGEILGVIGRNGAGKSTLLKILAAITEPSAGEARLWKKPAALLELGTGFQPDLSGRENVFLSAALCGLGRAETKKRFDEIVAFAEMEKCIDQPVKQYSSGMAVRLAFSVAIHTDRELLLLDEALAVGDYRFQVKSTERIEKMAREGATVLLVTHNLGLTERTCQRTLILEEGRPVFLGASSEAVREYLRRGAEGAPEWSQPAAPEEALRLRRVAVVSPQGDARGELGYHEAFRIVIDYDVNRSHPGTNVGFGISSESGGLCFASAEFDLQPELKAARKPGSYRAEVSIPAKWLNVGRYRVHVYWTTSPSPTDYRSLDAIEFEIAETGTPAARHGQVRHGLFQPELAWQVGLLPA